MILNLPSSSSFGATEDVLFALGFLLQVAHDSSRMVLPPLTIKFKDSNGPFSPNPNRPPLERLIWNVFPIAQWAAQKLKWDEQNIRSIGVKVKDSLESKMNVVILEPLFLPHTISKLQSYLASSPYTSPRSSSSPTAAKRQRISPTTLLKSLANDPLWIDVASQPSYAGLLRSLKGPLYSGNPLVTLEGVSSIKEKQGWEIRKEFKLERCEEEIVKEIEIVEIEVWVNADGRLSEDQSSMEDDVRDGMKVGEKLERTKVLKKVQRIKREPSRNRSSGGFCLESNAAAYI
jgi:hypothetical protein